MILLICICMKFMLCCLFASNLLTCMSMYVYACIIIFQYTSCMRVVLLRIATLKDVCGQLAHKSGSLDQTPIAGRRRNSKTLVKRMPIMKETQIRFHFRLAMWVFTCACLGRLVNYILAYMFALSNQGRCLCCEQALLLFALHICKSLRCYIIL